MNQDIMDTAVREITHCREMDRTRNFAVTTTAMYDAVYIKITTYDMDNRQYEFHSLIAAIFGIEEYTPDGDWTPEMRNIAHSGMYERIINPIPYSLSGFECIGIGHMTSNGTTCVIPYTKFGDVHINWDGSQLIVQILNRHGAPQSGAMHRLYLKLSEFNGKTTSLDDHMRGWKDE